MSCLLLFVVVKPVSHCGLTNSKKKKTKEKYEKTEKQNKNQSRNIETKFSRMKKSSSIVRYPEGLAHAMEGKVHKKRIAGNNCYLPFDLFLRHLARYTLVNVLGKTPLTSFFKRCVFRLVVAFFRSFGARRIYLL